MDDMAGYDLDAEYEAVRAGRFDEAGMILSNYTVVRRDCGATRSASCGASRRPSWAW